MDKSNITSGNDYAFLLISTLLESQNELGEEHKLDSNMLSNLFKRITEYANYTWEEYIKGNRETYLFGEDEMEEIYHKAIQDTTSELLEGLLEKEMVSIKGVNESGELLYGLTEKGEEFVENIKPNTYSDLERKKRGRSKY